MKQILYETGRPDDLTRELRSLRWLSKKIEKDKFVLKCIVGHFLVENWIWRQNKNIGKQKITCMMYWVIFSEMAESFIYIREGLKKI